MGKKRADRAEELILTEMASPAAVQSPSLHRRATLTDVPKELLRVIALLCDHPSSVALARVSRTLTEVAEVRIWQDVELSLNPHHGEYPLVRSHVPTITRPGHEWSIEAAKGAEDRHREALKEKVKEVIKHADHRRCGLVEALRMVPRPGAVAGMLMFLELVSTTIIVLDINAPTPHPFDQHWRHRDHELLDLKLVDARLHLPSLIYLRLGPGSIRFREAIPYLCSRAPNLVALEVHLDHAHHVVADVSLLPPSPSLDIRELYITCPNPDRLPDFAYVAPIVQLLKFTPKLKRFSLTYEGPEMTDPDELTSTLRSLSCLTEMDYRIDPFHIALGEQTGFSSLRRVLYRSSFWNPIIAEYPIFPSLEVIFFTPSYDEPHRLPDTSPTTQPMSAMWMDQRFAAELRSMPRLRIMHVLQQPIAGDPDLWRRLDDVEATGSANGYLHSVRHGGHEMLFCNFLFQHLEVSDHPLADSPTSVPIGVSRRAYTDMSGAEWETLFYHLPEARWQARTDFEGEVVPLEVVERMRVVDGKTEAEWNGRGISVGEDAWKVLTDWHEGVLAAKTDAALAPTAAWCVSSGTSSHPKLIQQIYLVCFPDVYCGGQGGL